MEEQKNSEVFIYQMVFYLVLLPAILVFYFYLMYLWLREMRSRMQERMEMNRYEEPAQPTDRVYTDAMNHNASESEV